MRTTAGPAFSAASAMASLRAIAEGAATACAVATGAGAGGTWSSVPARWRKETAQVEGGEDGQQRQRADRERSVHSCLRLGSAAGRSTSDAAVWA